MVLAIDFALRNGEDIVEEEVAKVRYVMTLPVIDSHGQVFNGLLILGLSLSFIDLVCDTFSGI